MSIHFNYDEHVLLCYFEAVLSPFDIMQKGSHYFYWLCFDLIVTSRPIPGAGDIYLFQFFL